MPGFDKTGPYGSGPTGWGKGGCIGENSISARCQGLGRGHRRPLTLDEEEKLLANRLNAIREFKKNTEEK